VALHWLDAPSISKNREVLKLGGFLPHIRFNKVLDLVLAAKSMLRSDIYVTQVFHLVPASRSQKISNAHLDYSFEEVTRHELEGREVIALGADASRACLRHGIKHQPTCHPSRRGATNACNAAEIVNAFSALGY
jgi:hypothetical protein